MIRALQPRLLAGHLLALVLTATAGGLGVWQIEAWQARRDAEALDLTSATPVPLTDVMGNDDPFPAPSVGQPVELSGTWLTSGTLFVEGREHDGVDGYWMLTPMSIGDPDAPAIPVVLGWVADPAEAPAPPTGEADLVGWLQPPDGTGQRDDDPSDDILPQLRIADVVQHVDRDLYSAYAVATEGVDGLPRADLAQLPEVGQFTAVRNLLYGIEWWVFGAFAVLIWWRWLKDELSEESHEEQPDTVSV